MKVITSQDNLVKFDNGLVIEGEGDRDCCAINYLDFEQLSLGTELPDMTAGQLIDAITMKDDGFSVKDVKGVPKWVQARSDQNGYYSTVTALSIKYKGTTVSLGDLSGVLSDGY